jgi:hypothetical protein
VPQRALLVLPVFVWGWAGDIQETKTCFLFSSFGFAALAMARAQQVCDITTNSVSFIIYQQTAHVVTLW